MAANNPNPDRASRSSTSSGALVPEAVALLPRAAGTSIPEAPAAAQSNGLLRWPARVGATEGTHALPERRESVEEVPQAESNAHA